MADRLRHGAAARQGRRSRDLWPGSRLLAGLTLRDVDRCAPDLDVLLANEDVARIRSVSPVDGRALVAFYDGLSDRSKYLRFFAAHPHLSPSEVLWFTDNDHVEREAVAAWYGDRMLGIAGWALTPG